jgi:hypothetical protein
MNPTTAELIRAYNRLKDSITMRQKTLDIILGKIARRIGRGGKYLDHDGFATGYFVPQAHVRGHYRRAHTAIRIGRTSRRTNRR